jgi:predicted DNA-binding ribbon-helix-helix protein
MERTIATTIRVPERVWRMLRALAEARSLADGGKPSVSAVITALTEEKARQDERA